MLVIVEEKPSIQELIEDEFSKGSIMIKIAKCESGLRQYNQNGEVLRGEENNLDVGIFQINEYYHLINAEKLGINIYTIKGNIEYAKYLYGVSGTTPWNWSKFCWNK